MSLIRFAGRAMLGGALIADGIDALRHPTEHTEAIEPWVAKIAESVPLPDDPSQVAKAAAGGVIAGGAMIATGLLGRLGACLASSVLAVATVVGYPFWTKKDKVERRQMTKGFVMHLAMLGGTVLVLAGPKKKAAKQTLKLAKPAGRGCCKGSKTK